MSLWGNPGSSNKLLQVWAMFSEGNLTRLLTKKNRGTNTLTVKSLFAQISYPPADNHKTMTYLDKYWKPPYEYKLGKKTVKKLKANQAKKAKKVKPSRPIDMSWLDHWKTL